LYLEQTVWHRAVAQYIRILVGRSAISGIEIAGSDGPLVQ
jgi:hypothetical protein